MRKILYTVYHNNTITFYQRNVVKSCKGFSFNHIFDIYDSDRMVNSASFM